MSTADIIIIVIIAICFITAIVFSIKNRNRCCSGCNGCCSGCSQKCDEKK